MRGSRRVAADNDRHGWSARALQSVPSGAAAQVRPAGRRPIDRSRGSSARSRPAPVLLLLCFLRAAPLGWAAEPPPTDFGDFIPTLGHDFTRGLFSKKNVAPLLVGGLAAAAVHPFDDQWTPKDESGSVGSTGAALGGPVVLGVVGGSLIAVPFTKNARFRAFTFDVTQAFIMDAVVVQSLKYAVHRTRPDQSNNKSFPSGHAADSFMLATVLTHHYGKKFGIPVYALATFVAYSRVDKKKHFASDVVFGGTLGYVMARTAIRGHVERADKRIAWFPTVGRGCVGVSLALNL